MSDRLAAILASSQIYREGRRRSVVTRLLQRMDLVLFIAADLRANVWQSSLSSVARDVDATTACLLYQAPKLHLVN